MLHLQLSERDVERLLAGEQPHDRPDLGELARFVAQLRAPAELEAPPPMSPRLLAELDVTEAQGSEHRDEMARRRVTARRRAKDARRRWRYVGAAAMLVMLGGIVATHLHGAFPDEATRTTNDESESNVKVTPTVPPTAAPTVTLPPTTLPPPPPQTTLPPPPPPPPPADTGDVGEVLPETGDRDQPGSGYDGPGRMDEWFEDFERWARDNCRWREDGWSRRCVEEFWDEYDNWGSFP